MVIRRCFNATLNHSTETLPLPRTTQLVQYFSGKLFPSIEEDGLYVPTSPFFPAVDMLWKEGTTLWGVRVHTGTNHREVLVGFRDMCVSSGWTEQSGKTVYLLWLSQNDDIAAWTNHQRVPTPENTSLQQLRTPRQWFPTVFACSIHELGAFMSDFPWTEND